MNVSDYFKQSRRSAPGNDGTDYVFLSDDRPEWLYDAVREAHDSELPNDWRYEMASSIVEAIEDGELAQDTIDEWADAQVETYTAPLLRWYADHVDRLGYVDEWQELMEGVNTGSVVDLLQGGQVVCIGAMARILLNACKANTIDTDTEPYETPDEPDEDVWRGER